MKIFRDIAICTLDFFVLFHFCECSATFEWIINFFFSWKNVPPIQSFVCYTQAPETRGGALLLLHLLTCFLNINISNIKSSTLPIDVSKIITTFFMNLTGIRIWGIYFKWKKKIENRCNEDAALYFSCFRIRMLFYYLLYVHLKIFFILLV